MSKKHIYIVMLLLSLFGKSIAHKVEKNVVKDFDGEDRDLNEVIDFIQKVLAEATPNNSRHPE